MKTMTSDTNCRKSTLITALGITALAFLTMVNIAGAAAVAPVADFSMSVKSGYVPLAVQFADKSEGATRWGWDFGDGYISAERNPSHFYNESGMYTVELTVTNDQGYSSLKTAKIEAFEEYPPIADFSSNVKSGYAPLSVQFLDESEHATKWSWDFGDGYTSTDQSPSHAYNDPGKYTVKLKVFNQQGYVSSKTDIIEVFEEYPPVADFSMSAKSGYAPLSVQFADESEGATKWSWDFGDGHTATGQNPSYTYFKAGKYTVNLTITNDQGYTSSKTAIIEVFEEYPPVADFITSVKSGYAPLTVQFTDKSEHATRWGWDFGDGYTSIDQSPSYIYNKPGIYTVELTVANDRSYTSSKTAIITVNKKGSSSKGSEGSSGGRSSGSSGGGACGSPEPQNNVEVKELSQAYVSSSQTANFKFTENVTPVVYIKFDSKKTLGKITAIAEMLKGKSALVSDLPSDPIYKSINVWVGSGGMASSNNIKNAVLCFKVDKAWIKDKNIDNTSIILNRYVNKKWERLPTTLLREDDKYIYFIAKTQEFSSFVITGKDTKAGAIKPEFVNETNYKPNESKVVETEQIPEQKANMNASGFEIVYGIMGLLGVFLSRRR